MTPNADRVYDPSSSDSEEHNAPPTRCPKPSQHFSGNGEAMLQGPVRIGDGHFRSCVRIVNEMGLHARPASLFIELANRFSCDVALHKGDQQVDGKSILQLLALSAEAGTTLVLDTRGVDAEEAGIALCRLIASGFDERMEQE